MVEIYRTMLPDAKTRALDKFVLFFLDLSETFFSSEENSKNVSIMLARNRTATAHRLQRDILLISSSLSVPLDPVPAVSAVR